MQSSPTSFAAPPPLPFPPPPRSTGQVTVLPLPPPYTGAPDSTFQITVLPAPPPPFPGPPSTVDLSPLEFLLALVAIITIPALIYTFIFAFKCPSFSRRESSAADFSLRLETPSRDVESAPVTASSADVKYQNEAHVKEIGGECPVCLSVFADGEEVRQLRACKHAFHASCIDMWLSNHSNCPICRATIAAAATATVKSSGSDRDGGDLQLGHRERDASNLV